jgi:putative ABC transport system ATP-binding protein
MSRPTLHAGAGPAACRAAAGARGAAAGAEDVPVIRMSSVSKVYGRDEGTVKALDSIDLEVARGEFVAVMGPSGSGKSTLMNIVGCLDRPSRGTYELDGQDVSRLSESQLAGVRLRDTGFIFQTFNLLPKLSALQNVELPMVYAGVPARRRRARAVELLTLVGLGHRVGHRPAEMSGGERQRVAVARSLVNDPALLLADEPTGNLDSKAGAEIVALLEALHREGRTIMLITHEREVAEHAERTVYMRDGKVMAA